jgi:hypothetical protein
VSFEQEKIIRRTSRKIRVYENHITQQRRDRLNWCLPENSNRWSLSEAMQQRSRSFEVLFANKIFLFGSTPLTE